MQNDDNTSSRIEILRFPLIVGVVFIHNYAAVVAQYEASIGLPRNGTLVEFVRFFVSEGLAQISVPLFFMISGYLFFRGGWSWTTYAGKLKRRLHTLLIPFLFWNLLALAVLAIAQSLPQTSMLAYSTRFSPVKSFSCFDYFNALFGLTVHYPISAQFWFIRDLMALIVLAPVINFFLAGRLALPFISVIGCLWIFPVWPLVWPSVLATSFFCFGAYLARPGINTGNLERFGEWICVIFFCFLLLNSALPGDRSYLPKLVIAFGAPSIWWLAGLAARAPRIRSTLIGLSSASFFVYAAHLPSLTIIDRSLYKLLAPAHGATVLALFFLIPISLIAFLLLVHRCLLKIMPSFLGFITGSPHRTNKQPG